MAALRPVSASQLADRCGRDPLVRGSFVQEEMVPLKPSAKVVYLLSGALLLAAIVFRFLVVFDLIEGALNLAFWIAIAGWMTASAAALQE